MAEGSLLHFVYWIYDETCICPRLHGYVGVTKNLSGRIKTHHKRFGTTSHAVLLTGSVIECRRLEHSLRPEDKIGWNTAPGGQRPPKWTAEAIEKVRAAKIGKPRSDEVKQKLRLANLGKRHSEETKAKLRKISLGNKWSSNFSEETREKIRQGQLGRKASAETIEKLRKVHLGSKRSKETRAKMRQAQLGHRHSEESKRKMSEAAYRRYAKQEN